MKFTSNYKLKKLEDGDPIDILDIGENMDILDRELKKKAETSGGDISKMTVKTLKASTAEFPIPEAGEDAETFLGKVKKFFEDTKNWMTGVCMLGQLVNNCVTNRSDLPLAAAQGKVLMDLYTQLYSDIGKLKLPYIDTSNPLSDICCGDHMTTPCNYTATSDCVVAGTLRLWGTNAHAAILIDDITISNCGGGDITYGNYYPVFYPLQAGQTISIRFNANTNGTNTVKAYGIK